MLEPLELGPRLDAELVDEPASRVAVCLERVGLPARAVEREHQLHAVPLAKRVSGNEALQLRQHLLVPAEGEVVVDALRERGEAQVVQPGDVVARGGPERHVGEGGPSPELERLAQGGRRLRRGLGLRSREERVEAARVEPIGRNRDRRSPAHASR